MILSDKRIKREISITEIKNSHLEANARIKELEKRTLNAYKAERRLMEMIDELGRISRELAASSDYLYDAAGLAYKAAFCEEKEEA
jgi:primosomal protein N''